MADHRAGSFAGLLDARKSISIDNIATMNTDYLRSKFKNRKALAR